MPKESNLELKVGLFMLIALVLLAMFIFSVSSSSVLKKGKSLKVVFGFANGLKRNAPVRIAGVDEGLVRNVQLFFDRADGRLPTGASAQLLGPTPRSVESRRSVGHGHRSEGEGIQNPRSIPFTAW